MGEGKVEKRNRPPVSCNPCRSRKLKCNRSLPCDTCIKRGKEDICQYAANADRSKAGAKKGAVADQLRRLEDMIFNLAEQKTSRSGPPTSSVSSGAQSTTTDSQVGADAHVDQNRPGFTESNHWLSIIEDIKDIRSQLSPGDLNSDSQLQDKPSSGPADSGGSSAASPANVPDLGFGHTRVRSLEEILKSVPARHLCDFWVSFYFQARFTTLPLLHPSIFQDEYEAFWKDPTKTSPLWIALLCSILSLAAGTGHLPEMSDEKTTKVPTVHEMSVLTENCLILGDYTRGGRYVMEALVLHLQSYYLTGKDPSRDVWFAAGVIVRLALRLGYHRDPSGQRNLANLTPYECEMRRRVWLSIYQLDALISFQIGLPSMIPVDSCDTMPPMNIELSYIDPELQELPPARPMSDHTTASYTIAKQPIIELFRRIVILTQSLIPRPYEETLQLDSMLRDAYNGLPNVLKAKPINRSLVDGNNLVIRRMTLEFLYNKSMIILHRQHLAHHGNAMVSQSHQACLKAALTVLDRLEEMHQAMKPGGFLYTDKWLLTTLNTGDMIFASVVVCLDLTIRVTTPPCACHTGMSPVPADELVTLEAELEAIQRAQKVWAALGESSNDARLAAGALEATIQRVLEYQRNQAAPYEAMQRISFDTSGVGLTASENVQFDPLTDSLHWEFIDQWMPDSDETMPDLAAWVLNGGGQNGV